MIAHRLDMAAVVLYLQSLSMKISFSCFKIYFKFSSACKHVEDAVEHRKEVYRTMHTDLVVCGTSALTLQTNASIMLREENAVVLRR